MSDSPFEPGDLEVERPAVRRGLGMAAGSFAFSVLVGLGSSVATSRLYGIRIIGEYALASVPYLIVSRLSSVNEQTAFVREAATMRRREPLLNAYFRAVLGFSTALTFVVGVIGMVAGALLLRGPQEQPHLVLPAVVILTAYVFLDNVGWNMDAVFSAFRAADVLFLVRAAQATTFLVAGVLLERPLHSVWGLVWATVLSFAVPLVLRLRVLGRFVHWRVGPEERAVARKALPGFLRFGAVLLPSQLLSGIKDQSGTWVVGAAAGTVMTGAYSRALGLASKTSEAGYRVGEVLLPGLVERSQPDDSSGAELLARTLRICAVPLALLVAGAGGAATGVLQVFGEGFDRANIALALLFGAYSLAVLTSVQSQWFLADGKPGKVMRMSLVSSAVSLALVLPLGLRYEADGVAFALLMGPAVEFVLFDRALGRELRSSNSLLGARVIGGTALAVAAGYTAAWGVQRLGTSLLWTATALGAGAGAAVLVVLAAGLVQRDERAAAVALAGRLRR